MDRIRRAPQAVFDPRAGEYIERYLRRADPHAASVLPVSGRLVPVDVNARTLDGEVYFGLREERWARTPEEVSVVAFVECTRIQAATYSDGAPGYRLRCAVTLVDRSTARLLRERSFDDGEPPPKKRHRGDAEVPAAVRGDHVPARVRAQLEGQEPARVRPKRSRTFSIHSNEAAPQTHQT